MAKILGPEEADVKVPAITEVLRPQYIAFGSGDGSFLLAEGDIVFLQDKVMEKVRASLENSAAVVSAITEEQFYAAVSDYNSMIIKTCTDLPASDYAVLLGFNHADSLNSISRISAIAFSEASPESMFVCDDTTWSYYRVLFEDASDFVQSSRDLLKLSDMVYYLSGNILGGSSRALIPLETTSSLTYTDYENEYDYGGRDMRNDMAESVFGKNFDFVRRITDSFGNITFMYGYGQKVFTANTDGSFTYTSERTNSTSKGFFDDLKLATEFASNCGGWLFDGGRSALALSGFEDDGGGRTANRTFYFTQYIGGYEICLENGNALTVHVESGQVTGLSRCVAVLNGVTRSSSVNDEADAPNVIAQNCNHIYNIINNNTLAAATDDAFNFASDAIREISIAFYRSAADDFMTPCWKIETDSGISFFFGLRTAFPLGFTR